MLAILINTTVEFEFVIIASFLFGHRHAHKQAEGIQLVDTRLQPLVKTAEKSEHNPLEVCPSFLTPTHTCTLIHTNKNTSSIQYKHTHLLTDWGVIWPQAFQMGCRLHKAPDAAISPTFLLEPKRLSKPDIQGLFQRHRCFIKCQSAWSKDVFYAVCRLQDSHVYSLTQMIKRMEGFLEAVISKIVF